MNNSNSIDIGTAAHPQAAPAISTTTTTDTTTTTTTIDLNPPPDLAHSTLSSLPPASSFLGQNPFAEGVNSAGVDVHNTTASDNGGYGDDDDDDDNGLGELKTSTTITPHDSFGLNPSNVDDGAVLRMSVAWDWDDASQSRWDSKQADVISPILNSSNGNNWSGVERIIGDSTTRGDSNYESYHHPLLYSPKGNDSDEDEDGAGRTSSSVAASDPGVTRPGLARAVEEFESFSSASGKGDDDDDDDDYDNHDKGSGVDGKRRRGTTNSRRSGADRKNTEDKEKTVLVHVVTSTDSLAGVSVKYGIPIAELRRANHLWASDSIHLRKILYIPLDRTRGTLKRGNGNMADTGPNTGISSTSSSSNHTGLLVSGPTSSLSSSSPPVNIHPTATIRRIPASQLSFSPPPSSSSSLSPSTRKAGIRSRINPHAQASASTPSLPAARRPPPPTRTLGSFFSTAGSSFFPDAITSRLSLTSSSEGDTEGQAHEMDQVMHGHGVHGATDATTPRTRVSFDESMTMDYADPPSSTSLRISRRRADMGIGLGSIMGMGSKARTVSSPSSFGLQSWFSSDNHSNSRGIGNNNDSSRSILDAAFFAPPSSMFADGSGGSGRPTLSVRTEQMAPSPEMRIPDLHSSPTSVAGAGSDTSGAFSLSPRTATRTRKGMTAGLSPPSPEAMSRRTRSRSSQGTVKPEPESAY